MMKENYQLQDSDQQQAEIIELFTADIKLDDELAQIIDELRKVETVIEKKSLIKKGLQRAIQERMGESEKIVNSWGDEIATWKYAKPSEKFDEKSFAKAHPRLYSAFKKIGECSRRFLLKKPKSA